jgi:hypothetical protein
MAGMVPLIGVAGSYLESLFHSSGSGAAAITKSHSNNPASTQNTSQVSPFAQILSDVQQLGQTGAAQFQQVTQQISGDLQSASQTAAGALNPLLQSLSSSQTGMLANNALNPMGIVESSLSSAGIRGI